MSPAHLDPADTVLVVVDMQERLLPAIHDSAQIVAGTRLLLRAAGTLKLPVLMTTQYRKGLGPTQVEVAELAPDLLAFDKLTFSCFGSKEFSEALTAANRRNLLLCGVETHICVLQTGLDALAAQYRVHLIADATGSRSLGNAELGRRRLESAGATLSSVEMAIYELLGASGTADFKSLLPHFK